MVDSLAAVGLLLAVPICESAESCESSIGIVVDEQTGAYRVFGPTRSTPQISAIVLGQSAADIDGDGEEDLLIVDDRDSAAGSGIAVVYDLSMGEPFVMHACPLGTTDIELAVSICISDYSNVTIATAYRGIDLLEAEFGNIALQADGPPAWDLGDGMLQNWIRQFDLTFARQSVDAARNAYHLATEAGVGTESARTALLSALALREQRADLHPFGE